VDVSGYRLAWVGYAEHDEHKTVRPVAHAGFEDGYLDTVRITWADSERGRGPVGAAIRTARPSVFQNIHADPHFTPWRSEAQRRGYAAVIGLPLLRDAVAFGTLALYAAEPNGFDEDEVRLLQELADDLAYGIGALRTRAAREQAERELEQARDRLQALYEASPDMIFVYRAGGSVLDVNENMLKAYGYTRAAALSAAPASFSGRGCDARPRSANIGGAPAPARRSTTNGWRGGRTARSSRWRCGCGDCPVARPRWWRWCATSARASAPSRRSPPWPTTIRSPRSPTARCCRTACAWH
jgi:PAS domain-containing protein